ncbi:MAG: pseudouridine synthase [Thermoleophilia bacterium]
MAERLQRVLAAAGLGSRRACEELIRAGRVTVDGVVAELGTRVDPTRQTVAVDGRPVDLEEKEYWVLNKPKGVISTVHDPHGRKTVVDCVPAGVRVFPVGRLDRDTTGVLVLTNDGDLAHRALHPRFGVTKEYRVVAAGRVSRRAVAALRAGVPLDDGVTAPAEVEVIRRGEERTELVVRIHEGRKRQVRRMLEAVGHPVVALHRSRFDGLSDEGLAVGRARRLSADEVEALRRAGGAE